MEYLLAILTVASVHFLALISPGPDFVLTVKASLLGSRKAGIYTALGLASGMLVHVTYTLVGIGFIISRSILLFSIIKYLGAAYLIYIGWKSLRSRREHYKIPESKRKETGMAGSWRTAFITNVTNPKVTLFFLSIFTLVVSPSTPLWVQLLMGLEMVTATLLWFSVVAMIFSHRLMQGKVQSVQYYAEKFLGAVLVALGVKLAFATGGK
jgi:RhtB (resistance to homoserine/threonine) family protein